MTSTATTNNEATPLWSYVPLAQYSLPAAPVAHTARVGLARLRRLLHRDEVETAALLKTEDELRVLPHRQLERIVPTPDCDAAAEALDVALADWLEQERAERPLILLVGPPHSAHAAILAAWAVRQNWRLLDPPTPEQLLAGDEAWLSAQCAADDPWVFPVLEKTYQRHAAGLALIRCFLDRAYAGELGRGIIGCDSWAWAFLRHVWHGRLPLTLALQAFDQARLADYFQQAARTADGKHLLFRQSNNGHYVLPPPDSAESAGESSNFLQLLAAHSRGIAGVAAAIWRIGLRTEPDATLTEEAATESAPLPHRTIWVTPWKDLKLPELPAGAGTDDAFVLHTLLLHNGLPFEILRRLLPMAPGQVMEILFRLEDAGLIIQQHHVWSVSAPGYPAVRQFLQANDYLVDTF